MTVVAALGITPSAFAHATLLTTTPSNGAVISRAPAAVRLHFDEPVITALGSIRVYDGNARRVDDGEVERPAATDVAIALDQGLPPDTYTVAWRVLSADSHPVRGAFVFHVGKPGAGASGVVSEVLDETGGSATVDDAFVVVRFVGLLLTLLCVGGTAFAARCVPGHDRSTRAAWLGVAVVAVSLVVASLAWIGLEGAQAAGLGLGSVLDPTLFREVVSTDFGTAWLIRVIVAALLGVAAIVAALSIRRVRTAATVAAIACAAVIAGVPALSGHARVAGALAVVSDWLHVVAAGAWVGGLAFLGLTLVQAGGDRWSLAGYSIPRFSSVATFAVAVLIGAGIVSGLVEIHSVSALWETTYGRLLLAKVALLVPLLGLGAWNNRRSVPELRSGATSRDLRRRFVTAVCCELALMVAVVGVTAALVAEKPARAAVTAAPVSARTTVGPFDLDLVVDPATTGVNEMHVYILDRSTGQPVAVDETRIAASLPAAGVGPLDLKATPAGPGHAVVTAASLPLAGEWMLVVTVRKGDFDEWSTTLNIPIRKDSNP